jgi:hypothetical protein
MKVAASEAIGAEAKCPSRLEPFSREMVRNEREQSQHFVSLGANAKSGIGKDFRRSRDAAKERCGEEGARLKSQPHHLIAVL